MVGLWIILCSIATWVIIVICFYSLHKEISDLEMKIDVILDRGHEEKPSDKKDPEEQEIEDNTQLISNVYNIVDDILDGKLDLEDVGKEDKADEVQ